MNILANGKPREVDEGTSVAGFLAGLGWRPEWVVVEHNGEPLERGRFSEVILRGGDRLEVVRAVAGGAGNSASETPVGRSRRARLAAAKLYLVTGGQRPDLEQFLDAVLGAGVDIVQLREKDMEAGPQLTLAERFRAACDRHGALFVMNDRVDLAIACGADGVHLGQDDLPVPVARDQIGPDAVIGVSTHSAEQFAAAMAGDGDYACAGPIHETPTKPGRAAVGYGLVKVAAAEARKPWFAIGGIDLGNVADVVAAGAGAIVVVRAITEAPDPASAARALRSAIPV